MGDLQRRVCAGDLHIVPCLEEMQTQPRTPHPTLVLVTA